LSEKKFFTKMSVIACYIELFICLIRASIRNIAFVVRTHRMMDLPLATHHPD
jgi:hypothetical protein